ncbi:MAG: dTDP-4-dehydrorhamnose reductase [Bacteroidia bacterium]|nr:dTDP-4-dehydrorhamnose reductase [Bacteroidia bacterium]
MKKILIIGAKGQLGSDINTCLRNNNYKTLTPNHEELDITNFEKVKEYILKNKPEIIINTAAYHHVDKCEEFPFLATLINSNAPTYISKLCKEINCKFIHFSTDYVFDGAKGKPYVETDLPNPLNVYGKSKYEGEKEILKANDHALIIRVSALYGVNPCRAKNGLNFIQLMLKLASERDEITVVGDEYVSPTATFDIANILPEIIAKDLSGIVHLTSEGACSWYEFAKEIMDYTNTNINIKQVPSSHFPAKTPRPKYSVLENQTLKNNGIKSMPHWRDALHIYLNTITKITKKLK